MALKLALGGGVDRSKTLQYRKALFDGEWIPGFEPQPEPDIFDLEKWGEVEPSPCNCVACGAAVEEAILCPLCESPFCSECYSTDPGFLLFDCCCSCLYTIGPWAGRDVPLTVAGVMGKLWRGLAVVGSCRLEPGEVVAQRICNALPVTCLGSTRSTREYVAATEWDENGRPLFYADTSILGSHSFSQPFPILADAQCCSAPWNCRMEVTLIPFRVTNRPLCLVTLRVTRPIVVPKGRAVRLRCRPQQTGIGMVGQGDPLLVAEAAAVPASLGLMVAKYCALAGNPLECYPPVPRRCPPGFLDAVIELREPLWLPFGTPAMSLVDVLEPDSESDGGAGGDEEEEEAEDGDEGKEGEEDDEDEEDEESREGGSEGESDSDEGEATPKASVPGKRGESREAREFRDDRRSREAGGTGGTGRARRAAKGKSEKRA